MRDPTMSSLSKSVFLSLWVAYMLAATVVALLHLLPPAADIAWLGVLLTTMPLLLQRLMVIPPRLHSRPRVPVSLIFAWAGVGFTAYWNLLRDGTLEPAFLVATIGFLGVIGHELWYSEIARRQSPAIGLGKPLPPFMAIDPEGRPVHSKFFRGQPTILVFFRGDWCPASMAQIAALAAHSLEITAHGARIVLLSPQPQRRNAELARKFGAPLLFLTDPFGGIARDFGIGQQHATPFGLGLLGYRGDGVWPTVIITDAENRILFADQTEDDHQRPSPQMLCRVLWGMARPSSLGLAGPAGVTLLPIDQSGANAA